MRLTGDAVMEVILQMRPNGRCLDHYRIALDGTVLETQVVATHVFRAPVLAKYRLVVARHLFLLCFPPRPSRDLLFLTHVVHI